MSVLRRDVLLSSAVCLNLRVLKLRAVKLCVLHELLSAGVIRDANVRMCACAYVCICACVRLRYLGG